MYLASPRRWRNAEPAARLVLCLGCVMDLLYSSALRAANKWTRWTLQLLLPSGPLQYTTPGDLTPYSFSQYTDSISGKAALCFFFFCVAGDGCCRCCSDALWWEAPQSQSWCLNQSSQWGKKNTKTCILDMWSSGAAPVYEFNLLDKRLVWTFWKVGNKMRQDSSFPFWHKQAGTGYSNFWATYNNNFMSFVCVLLHF